MKTIIKGQINVQDRVVSRIYRGSKIIKTQTACVGQAPDGTPLISVFVWMEADTSKMIEYTTFAWIPTGGTLPLEHYEYVDSVFVGSVELHLYLLPGAPVDMAQVAKFEKARSNAGQPSIITRG